MVPFPGHGAGIVDHRVHRIEQGPIPVLFQNPPTPLNRVILAMIRRILRQAYGEVIALGKLHQAVHELGPPTVALRAIVQIDEQRRDVGKALFDRLSPID